MAFCTACGTQLPDNARFCPKCGATIASGGTAATATPARPADLHASFPNQSGQPHGGQPNGGQPNRGQPHGGGFDQPVPGGGGGVGWILPGLIVLALLVIAVVMLLPRRDDAVTRTETAQGATGEGATPAPSDGGGRAVDEASVAADRAGSATAAATNGSIPVTSAAVLDSAFFSNPAGAAVRYAGPVRVSGIIASMVQPGPTPALSLEGRTRFNYMIVNFPVGYRQRLAMLSKGQFISVACAEARSLGGTTILSGCELE